MLLELWKWLFGEPMDRDRFNDRHDSYPITINTLDPRCILDKLDSLARKVDFLTELIKGQVVATDPALLKRIQDQGEALKAVADTAESIPKKGETP